MPNENNKTWKYNYGEKSFKAPFIIYADLECLLEKIHSTFTSCLFDPTKKHLIVTKVKTVGKFLQRLEKVCNENNDLWKNKKWYH